MIKKIITVMSAVGFSYGAPLDPFPTGFSGMEIEAKWQATEQQYVDIINYFSSLDNLTWEGNVVEVRWGGRTRQYTDIYYDVNSTLADDGTSIRWRTRKENGTSSASPLSGGWMRTWSSLENLTWLESWQRVQYKEVPYRYGDVWFREESGNCNLGEAPCVGATVTNVLDGSFSHEATDALKGDHGANFFTQNALVPTKKVVDYRFRVELDGGTFEISVDRLREYEWDGSAWVEITPGQDYYEIELELNSSKTELNVQKLYDLTHKLRTDYGGGQYSTGLIGSSVSKAGVESARYGLIGTRPTSGASSWYGDIETAISSTANSTTLVLEPAIYLPSDTIYPEERKLRSRNPETGSKKDIATTIISAQNIDLFDSFVELDGGCDIRGLTFVDPGNTANWGDRRIHLLGGNQGHLEDCVFKVCLYLYQAYSVEFEKCRFEVSERSGYQAVYMNDTLEITFENCCFSNCIHMPIIAINCDDTDIFTCQFNGNRGSVGIVGGICEIRGSSFMHTGNGFFNLTNGTAYSSGAGVGALVLASGADCHVETSKFQWNQNASASAGNISGIAVNGSTLNLNEGVLISGNSGGDLYVTGATGVAYIREGASVEGLSLAENGGSIHAE